VRSLILFLLAFILIGGAIVGGDDHGAGGDRVSYADFLFAAGEKLDCYFTIETWWGSDRFRWCCEGPRIRDEKLTTVDALIAKLQRDFAGIDVVRDRDNGRIIHLIETGLPMQNDYVIEKEAALDYSGALEDLPDALRKTVPRIWRCDSALGVDFKNDVVTTVKVHLGKEKIRKLLTDAVPLQNYGRILWIAKTLIQRDARSITEITYVGPKQISASAQNEGAVVEISVPAKCTFGRPVPATVSIRNKGDKVFFCDEVSVMPNERMEMNLVNRETKVPVEMTKYGKNFMKSIKLLATQSGIAKLEKGESGTWTIDLDEFFAPARGNYRFSATFLLRRDEQYHLFKVTVDDLDFGVSD